MMMDEKAKIPHSTGNKDYGFYYYWFGPQAWSFFSLLYFLAFWSIRFGISVDSFERSATVRTHKFVYKPSSHLLQFCYSIMKCSYHWLWAYQDVCCPSRWF